MRVPDQRVRLPEARGEVGVLRRQHRRRAMRAVHVEPEPALPAEVGDRLERIEGPRGRGAGAGDDGEHLASGALGRGERLRQCLGSEAKSLIHRDGEDSRAAEAEDLRRPLHAVVRLVRHEDGQWLAAGEPLLPDVATADRLPCREERGEVSDRAARGQHSVRTRRATLPAAPSRRARVARAAPRPGPSRTPPSRCSGAPRRGGPAPRRAGARSPDARRSAGGGGGWTRRGRGPSARRARCRAAPAAIRASVPDWPRARPRGAPVLRGRSRCAGNRPAGRPGRARRGGSARGRRRLGVSQGERPWSAQRARVEAEAPSTVADAPL